jgi:hypothetical protein
MIWFKLGAFSFLPRWLIDVALAIHFYEAILATLAIIVWHLYNVMFDPDVYPLDWVLVDGKISEERLKEEHPIAYRETLEAASVGEATGTETAESGGTVSYQPSPASGAD